VLTAELTGRNPGFSPAEDTDDLFVGKTLLHWDVLMWLMKTLLTLWCVNQRGAGQLTDLSYSVREGETVLEHIATLLSVASTVMTIVWAFKAKTALSDYSLNEFKFELKMNPFHMFVFIIYYIVSFINDMESELKKRNIIHSKQAS